VSVRLLDQWSPPDGAGAPVACLATTFTFDADFFAQDCISRFLSLSTAVGEGDRISSVAAMLEEEEGLGEAQVTVLVDRSSPADKRNLRWDVLPVAVSSGLLHAKVAVLLWQRHGRILIGSANLTAAGYRRQVEIALTIEMDENCRVPRPLLEQLTGELRHLVNLAPGPASAGPKARAFRTLDQLAQRISMLALPDRGTGAIMLSLAPGRPGVRPLDRLRDVWRGALPLRATVLSPFWDAEAPAPGIVAVQKLLTGRPAARRRLILVAATNPYTGEVQGPPSLANQSGVDLVAFTPPDKELRSLHGKVVLVESDTWTAALVGSSNTTRDGLGLHSARGHEELNLWIGCPAGSKEAKALRTLAGAGEPIRAEERGWEEVPDEDEPTTPQLPLGFLSCLVEPGLPARANLSLDPDHLPASWEVREPAGHTLLDADSWQADGSRAETHVTLHSEGLPAFLVVRWTDSSGPSQATWVANVTDRASLPSPAKLSELPVDVLLAALASTRPLPVALEQELRRRERLKATASSIDLDPLRRFSGSGQLLQRARRISLALWRLQERLSRPTNSMDTLRWRLSGALGPLTIAEGIVADAAGDHVLPGEAHFLLAELALTIAAVDWSAVAGTLNPVQTNGLVSEVLAKLEALRKDLPKAPDQALDKYVQDALEVARR
jgi:hypothetical protein